MYTFFFFGTLCAILFFTGQGLLTEASVLLCCPAQSLARDWRVINAYGQVTKEYNVLNRVLMTRVYALVSGFHLRVEIVECDSC